jgi:hypothetical protein
MKIDLKLTHEEITIITATLQPLYNTKAHTRRHKATLSIAMDLIALLDKKFTALKLKTDLFNSNKTIKISLKFHEADMLELILIQKIGDADDHYIRQKIQKVINILNQKLA